MTRILTIIALLFATPAWAETVLYCQDELAAGIGKQNGSFVEGKVELHRYTLKFDEKILTLQGFKVGASVPAHMSCSRATPVMHPELIFCVDTLRSYHSFIFSTQSLRYSYSQPNFGSWILDGGDTALMSHGTCQKF